LGENKISTDKLVSECSDNQLVFKLADGDKKALAELMKRYRSRALNFACRYLGDFDEAEDAVQECFVKIYFNRGRFDYEKAFKPWFYTILTNCCRDRIRKKTLFMSMLERFKAHREQENPEPVETDNEQAKMLQKALSRLSPSKREILSLRFNEDMSYQEIAETLGVSQGTVMSRLFRAKKELETILKNMGVIS
jgi:RNA polymerase sigma-70 factor (ECF subfamily)